MRIFFNKMFFILYKLYVGVVVSFWSLVFVPTGTLLMSFFSSKKYTIPICMIFGHLCSRLILFFLFIRTKGIKTRDLSIKTPCVFIFNHTGYIDNYLIATITPLRSLIVMKYGVLKYPLYGKFFKNAGHIFIKRKISKQWRATLDELIKILNEKYFSLIIFPEGKISEDGNLANFKKGAFEIAIKSNLPICPIFIENNKKFNNSSVYVKPSVIKFHMLKTIETSGLTIRDKNNLANNVYSEFLKKEKDLQLANKKKYL